MHDVKVVSDEWISQCASQNPQARVPMDEHVRQVGEAGGPGQSADKGGGVGDAGEECSSLEEPARKRSKTAGSDDTRTKKKYVIVLMVKEPEADSDFYKMKQLCKETCSAHVHDNCAQFAGSKSTH